MSNVVWWLDPLNGEISLFHKAKSYSNHWIVFLLAVPEKKNIKKSYSPMDDSTILFYFIFFYQRSLQILVWKREMLLAFLDFFFFFLAKHQNYVVFNSANLQCFLRAK